MPSDSAPIDSLPSETELAARANAATAARDTEAALLIWAAMRDRFPDARQGWLRPVELLTDANRLDEAEVLLDQAMSRFPDDFWFGRAHAIAAKIRGDHAEALVRYRGLRHRFPGQPAAWSDFASWLLEAGSPIVAEAEAKAGLAVFPDFDWLLQTHARCADALGDKVQSAARWRTLITRQPLHQPAFAEAVRALIGTGQVDEAIGMGQEALRLFPGHSQLRTELEAAAAKQSAAEAPTHADNSAGESDPDAATRALAAEQRNDWAGAARLWLTVRTASPAQPQAYAGSARALLRLGRTAEAELVLAKARRDLPADRHVLDQWAAAARAWGDREVALRRYQHLARAFPDDPAGATGAAGLMVESGRCFDAAALLAPFAALAGSDARLARRLAETASARHEWQEAARRWGAASQDFPDDPAVPIPFAEALRRTGQWAEADVMLTDAQARFPDDVEIAWAWAASCPAEVGYAPAIDRWQALRRRFPAHQPIYLALTECFQAARLHEEAEAVLTDACARFPDDATLASRHADAAAKRGDFAEAARRLERTESARHSGWRSAPMEPAGQPPGQSNTERVAIATATSLDGLFRLRAFLHELVAQSVPGSLPSVFIAVPDRAARDALASMLAANAGLKPVEAKAVLTEISPAAVSDGDQDRHHPDAGSARAKQFLAANRYQLAAVQTAFEAGYDAVIYLDSRTRMFRRGDLGAVVREAVRRREYRYTRQPNAPALRMGPSHTEGWATTVQRASVLSVWPGIDAAHVLLDTCGWNENLPIFERAAFRAFSRAMLGQGGSEMEPRVTAALAARLLPWAEAWMAYMAHALLASPMPYRIIDLDSTVGMYGATSGSAVAFHEAIRETAFDPRIVQALDPPFVTDTPNPVPPRFLGDHLAPGVCLVLPDRYTVQVSTP
jgi:predicted Zn-dependent protease